VTVQLREADVIRLDAARGELGRSAWCRSAIVATFGGQPSRPEPVRPEPAAKRRAAPSVPQPRASAPPATAPKRYRCNHTGTRTIGGYCSPCDVVVESGGLLPMGYVPPWAAP